MGNERTEAGQGEIEGLLPHRPPFLFVDEIVRADREKIIARHVFTETEFFFRGHFPQYPVVPGVILVETMAQSGGAGLRKLGILGGDALFFLGSVDKVKFRRQVRPGEELRSEIENLRISPRMIKQAGKAYVGDEIAAEAEWLCLVGPGPGPPAQITRYKELR
ncbi:MAG: 3-hydroxyacyl-ACP dehydratase FabZ [Spirochaetaceae bacterium]|jgi:3-hydroxyacyl-[acyl-carrier-protein] dehydratase|nr:3-hydroxyacyl-ACP dehydratase FabZ [Spirochaetaceae bacterium]